MQPSDPDAVKRYEHILSFMKSVVAGSVAEEPRVLDVAAGTGIAGVALAEALLAAGARRVELVATDARGEDLGKVHEWIRMRGLGGVEAATMVVDASALPRSIRCCYDYVVLWGSSLPHFSPWSYALFLAGAADLGSRDSVLLVEQRDVLPRVLHTNTYMHVYPWPIDDEGRGGISIYTGYDPITGLDARANYALPGFRYIGRSRMRLWDIASIAAYTWIFYEETLIHADVETGLAGKTYVVEARRPRVNRPGYTELLDTMPPEVREKLGVSAWDA